MGTLPISLTAAAAKDPIMQHANDGFAAVSVHKERAVELPDTCVLLAFTAACPHAFRVEGRRFWAFQFHPELDRETLVERLTIYRSQYAADTTQLDAVLSAAR